MRPIPAAARRCLPALLCLLAATPARAQAAPDGAGVVRAVAERAEREARAVRDFTVVQDVSGTPVTLRFERRDGDGGPVWRVRAVAGGGQGGLVAVAARDLAQWQADLPALLREHAGRFRYLRADTLRGRAVHVVQTSGAPLALGGSSAPTQATFWVDAEGSVPLRIALRGTVVGAAGRGEPTETVVELSGHRAAAPGGPVLPFRTRLVTERSSMVPPRPMAEEMRAGIDRLRARHGLSAEARARLDAMARMVDAAVERGALEVEIEIREVRAGAGPPTAMVEARRRAAVAGCRCETESA